MNNLKKYVHNVASDEIIIEDLDDNEKSALEAEIAKNAEEKLAKQNEEKVLWENKVSAYQKLGLTAQEIEAIAPKPSFLLPAKTNNPDNI